MTKSDIYNTIEAIKPTLSYGTRFEYPSSATKGFDVLLEISFTNTMQEGTIVRLTDKGFGFIGREGEEKDLFFHSSELADVSFDDLREGDKVTFEVAESPKGLNAVKVSRA